MSRAVMQQALEALEKATRFMSDSDYKKLNQAIEALRAALAEPEQEPVNKYCCHACFNKSGQFFLDRMILCPKCGNKRCPKASHHDLPCTNSNEPGQEGSIYTAPTQRKPQTTHWEGCEAVHPECRAKTELERKSDAIQRLWKERDELRTLNAELVEALRWCIRQMPEPVLPGDYTDGYKKARAALAKAQGESNGQD